MNANRMKEKGLDLLIAGEAKAADAVFCELTIKAGEPVCVTTAELSSAFLNRHGYGRATDLMVAELNDDLRALASRPAVQREIQIARGATQALVAIERLAARTTEHETAAATTQRQRVDDLARTGVFVANPTPIKVENLMTHRSNTAATPSATPTRTPLPPDMPKALAAILAALSLPDTADMPTLAAAFQALLAAVGAPDSSLNESEALAVAATPGMTAATFLRTKHHHRVALTASSPSRMLQAVADALGIPASNLSALRAAFEKLLEVTEGMPSIVGASARATRSL